MKALTKLTLLALVLVIALPALAQGPMPFPPGLAKKLAARASNYTEVTLDKNTLNFASQFMKEKHKDHGKVQVGSLLHNLKAIYVRTYEFKDAGEYSAADLERIRSQFRGPEWVPMVQSRSHSKQGLEISDIYQKMVNGESEGMLILNAEPKELNFVYIDGHINPSDLGAIGGNLGVPQLHTRPQSNHGSTSSSHAGGNQ